jgi:hypothetical protein
MVKNLRIYDLQINHIKIVDLRFVDWHNLGFEDL